MERISFSVERVNLFYYLDIKFKFGIEDAKHFILNFSKDAKCTLCDKPVEQNIKDRSSNVKRHFLSHHWPVLQAYLLRRNSEQATDDAATIRNPIRNFVLYAATSTFPLFHLKNPYLKVSKLSLNII